MRKRQDRKQEPQFLARGSKVNRLRSILFLIPAWFSPASAIRVFFHRLRGVNIGRKVEIGYFCIIGNVHPNMITIEDGAVVTAGSVLLEHDNAHYYACGGDVKFGPILIKEKAFIGIHSVVLPNVTIGRSAIVGANSLVLKDVPSNVVVGGVPARIIK